MASVASAVSVVMMEMLGGYLPLCWGWEMAFPRGVLEAGIVISCLVVSRLIGQLHAMRWIEYLELVCPELNPRDSVTEQGDMINIRLIQILEEQTSWVENYRTKIVLDIAHHKGCNRKE